MGEMCVDDIVRDQVMALPSVLNYRIWSSGPRSAPGLPIRRHQASKLRKNLFGPVDHSENLRFVHEELEKITKEDSERWNFDFKTEQPKEGRYEWVAVGEGATKMNPPPQLTCLTANNVNVKSVKRLSASPPAKMRQRLCTDYFRLNKSTKPKAKSERKAEREVVPSRTPEKRSAVAIR
ncbi:cyclin-dependent kinase inhibitor 1B-like [Penaeus monodon]|uniref:cyclin-dependent kinase inhibitor 1B-like n=1 Tax=Penaeus monodon TaxID=6687 RepID=UPI0018A72FE2|nr:cyclin-dependent kinase inhibitor 1B-like [Penaeus monodon]